VRATVNGVLTDLSLRPGDYVTAGNPIAALVDSDSFYVEGYFEETKLPRIHPGDRATVQLMGTRELLQGKVVGIAGGVFDRQRSVGSNLLPNINPTFTWVRLAQRVPVRVQLDAVPPTIQMVAGRTATVTILPPIPRQ
jgi:multidrug resistance efflux pump